MARAPDFTAAEIITIRSMAARGCDGREIALAIGRAPSSVRAKAVGLGVSLRPRKQQWHRMRILVEPRIQQAIMLAARRRGMRSGDFARRILTAVSVFDLYDVVLDAHARAAKVIAVEVAKRKG
jgi:hypothetical protein